MTTRPCDHTSVGVLVFRENVLLLIDRKRPPFGLAAPAGHVDLHGSEDVSEMTRYEQAARDELQEETGLVATGLTLVMEGRKENICRRAGGSWHYWRIYEADVTANLAPSTEETSGAFWCTHSQIKELLDGNTILIPRGHVALEPVWREWFIQIDILSRF